MPYKPYSVLEAERNARFEAADRVVHPVETEWHYERMTRHGFVPDEKSGIGFVRAYNYRKGNIKIRVATGVNADYWNDERGAARLPC